MSRGGDSSKSFDVRVVLDILDVTCPGVCMCPRGTVYLDVRLFGCNGNTSCAEPRFPLVFNETFSFHQNFARLADLRDVQKSLEDTCVRIALVQVNGTRRIVLATYKNNVGDVLYPERSRLNKNGEFSLFMKNEPLFPGTLSPRITLVTRTSVTEQITRDGGDDDRPRRSETQCRPNRMRPVHHDRSTTSSRPSRGDKQSRTSSPTETDSANTDSDADGRPSHRSRRTTKTDRAMDCERHFDKTRKRCEDVNRPNVNGNKTSQQNCIRIPLENKSSDEYENGVITTENEFGKHVKATFKLEGHHHKCCKSMSNNNDGADESIKTSDDSVRDKTNIRKNGYEVNEDRGQKPRKPGPKIDLHLDVYYCKCGVSDCASSPSWKNICREVNKKDPMEDAIKYHAFLRNRYRRFYDGATYQLCRNLKLL